MMNYINGLLYKYVIIYLFFEDFFFFTKVMRNLHVVFTMNPSANGLRDRASTSPALFNRCVLDWLGD